MNRIASKNIFSALILLLCFHFTWAQTPEVKTIDKLKGSMAEIVSVRGSSFGTNATNLAVNFGAQRGTIEAITNQLLQVRVPAGATYNNITVTNTTNGLTGYSAEQFLLSYSGTHPFDINNLNSQVNFVTGIDLYDVCLCDLDNDGKSDMATANKGENSISIMRNTSTGVGNINFTEIPFAVGFPTLHVRCGDLNGDGKQDLVLTQGGTSSVRDQLFILQNTSAGAGSFTFSMQSIKLTGRKNSKADIADMDLDGKPEVIVTDEGSNTVTVLINQSSLTNIAFAPAPVEIIIAGAASTDGIAVEDLNGDFLPEIVSSQYQTSTSKLFIIPNTSVIGTVNFGTVTTLTIGNTVKRIKIGDLDGDKKPDITVSQLLGSSLSIFRNTGTGSAISFGAPVLIITEANPWGIDFGDMDGDGKTDIVAASVTLPKLTILNNESTPGNFVFTKLAPTISFAGRHVRVGDVDGDGKPDIVYTGIDASNPARVGVLRNKSCVSPVINPVETPLSLCTGILPYRLTATLSRGSFYQWLKDGAVISCGLNQNTFDVTAASGDGNYTVKILGEGANCTTTGGCAEESIGINITILTGSAAISNPIYNDNNGPVCIGSPLKLSIANPIGGATYKWSGPEGYTATGASQSIPNFQLINAGIYYVDVTVGGCIAKRESVVAEVIDVPTFTISVPGSPVICQGDPSKTLTVVPAPGSFTYQWFKDGSLVGAGATFAVTSVAASSGNYTVKASYSGCTTIETAPAKIEIASLPVALFTVAPSACANQKVLFANQSTFDANSTPVYLWDFDDTQSSNLKDPEHIFTAANTYDVILKVSYAGGACPATTSKQIIVTAAPSVAITNPNNKYILCEGSPLKLEVVGTFNTYTWSTGATTPSIEVTQGGTYTVDVTTNTCTLTATRVVDELEAPEILISATPEQINEGETSQLEASGLTNYAWTPAETLSSPTLSNPIATPLQTTTYTVTGLGANNCEGSAIIIVNVAGEVIVNKLIPNNFFSPNNNGPNEIWKVSNILDYPQCAVTIYDEKGVKVFDAKPYQNDWSGTFNGKALPDGVYFYMIRCDGEESSPRTGSITLIR